MSDNWIVQNLENALETWNDKLGEIWTILTQSPMDFKGGEIWDIVASIHGALQAIGFALLVLFFVSGVIKTCGSFAEVKKPEQVFKLFVRFALSKAVITYGLDLMMVIFKIVQGVIRTIMNTAGLGRVDEAVLPARMITAIEECGFLESIPLWAVTIGTDITRYPYKIIHNELGIEKCSFYDLRGSYATKILNNGVEIRDVADILCHRNIETTENFYISSTEKSKKYATEVFDNITKSETINKVIEYNLEKCMCI